MLFRTLILSELACPQNWPATLSNLVFCLFVLPLVFLAVCQFALGQSQRSSLMWEWLCVHLSLSHPCSHHVELKGNPQSVSLCLSLFYRPSLHYSFTVHPSVRPIICPRWLRYMENIPLSVFPRHQSLCLSLCVCPFVHLSVRPSHRLSVCPSICLWPCHPMHHVVDWKWMVLSLRVLIRVPDSLCEESISH